MNEKQQLYRKIIVYSMLSALVAMDARRAREQDASKDASVHPPGGDNSGKRPHRDSQN